MAYVPQALGSVSGSATGSTSSAASQSGSQDRQLTIYGFNDVTTATTSDNGDDHDYEFTLELFQPRHYQNRHLYLPQHQYQQFQPQQTRMQLQPYALPNPMRGLALPSTSLVELWFNHVCGIWAALDSPANPFRRLCSDLWTSNEAVFFSLQTMAAASLPRRPPSINEIVMLAPQMSTQALIQELQELFGSVGADTAAPQTLAFPAGLLTSLFCMSSSLSWIDARQLGTQYLRNARSVIDLLDLRAGQLSLEDRELLEFFRGCLLYEEMLRSVVTDDQEDIQALLDWTPPRIKSEDDGGLAMAGNCEERERGTNANGGGDINLGDLHSWVGVPIVLIGLFGKVMALCRRSRKVWRKTGRATYQLLYLAMQDIREGQELEEMLMSIEIPQAAIGVSISSGSNETTPEPMSSEKALRTHIYKAAEVFRLSSLLQLYQTFPDLVAQHRMRHNLDAGVCASNNSGETVLASALVLPLVLHIVDLLCEIPAESPMRCLQPLLCLCAGSALRQDVPSPVAAVAAVADGSAALEGSMAASVTDSQTGSPTGSLASVGTSNGSVWSGPAAIDNVMAQPPPPVEPAAVLAARDAMRRRLARLEQNLPPRPITVARQLLETVWQRYDMEKAPSRSHWLDIMAETNFESVFG